MPEAWAEFSAAAPRACTPSPHGSNDTVCMSGAAAEQAQNSRQGRQAALLSMHTPRPPTTLPGTSPSCPHCPPASSPATLHAPAPPPPPESASQPGPPAVPPHPPAPPPGWSARRPSRRAAAPAPPPRAHCGLKREGGAHPCQEPQHSMIGSRVRGSGFYKARSNGHAQQRRARVQHSAIHGRHSRSAYVFESGSCALRKVYHPAFPAATKLAQRSSRVAQKQVHTHTPAVSTRPERLLQPPKLVIPAACPHQVFVLKSGSVRSVHSNPHVRICCAWFQIAWSSPAHPPLLNLSPTCTPPSFISGQSKSARNPRQQPTAHMSWSSNSLRRRRASSSSVAGV